MNVNTNEFHYRWKLSLMRRVNITSSIEEPVDQEGPGVIAGRELA